MSNPLADANELAGRLIAQARVELKDTWDDLRQREVRELEDAAQDLARILADGIRGSSSLERELPHVQARIANWTWVGADRVRARWQHWLDQAAEEAMRVLKAVAKGLIA